VECTCITNTIVTFSFHHLPLFFSGCIVAPRSYPPLWVMQMQWIVNELRHFRVQSCGSWSSVIMSMKRTKKRTGICRDNQWLWQTVKHHVVGDCEESLMAVLCWWKLVIPTCIDNPSKSGSMGFDWRVYLQSLALSFWAFPCALPFSFSASSSEVKFFSIAASPRNYATCFALSWRSRCHEEGGKDKWSTNPSLTNTTTNLQTDWTMLEKLIRSLHRGFP
jgi:hypothetical protein